MEDQKNVLKELKELKAIIAILIGTADLPIKERFSVKSLNEAAKAFQQMQIERGEWVREDDISKYIKKAPYRAGRFIREEFGFTNYFTRGRYSYFYNKKDLMALNEELKSRNINLERYIQLKEDQANFKKSLLKIAKKSKAYQLPEGLQDITTSPAKTPDPDIVREDLRKQESEFFENKFGEYIDIYEGTHAMLKSIYWFEKYIDYSLKKRIKKWCEDFNYTNHVLKEITKKKEFFIPVPEKEMIRL